MTGRIRLIWIVLAAALAAAAVVACVYAAFFGPLVNQPGGNPQETVVRFFDCLKSGDYTGMYACLADYETLGLENTPESAEARMIYNALKQSYGCTLKGACSIDGLSAVQGVRLRALNLRRTEQAVAGTVDDYLEAMVDALPLNEVYDNSGGYLTGLTDRVYAAALEQALRNPDPLTAETELEIHLRYVDGDWRIETDRALQNALVGGEG